MACAADPGACFPGIVARGRDAQPMVSLTRFGRKLKLPSVLEIKHQLLLRWLADQTAREAVATPAVETQAAAIQVPDGAASLPRQTP
jgi:hypothetical protein